MAITNIGASQLRASPFDTVIAELECAEDRNGPFYQLLVEARRLQNEDGSPFGSHAEALSSCIKKLESSQQKKSKTRRLVSTLQPFVDGLLQYTNAVDTVVQAGPAPAALLYGGAKLVLQLAHGFTECFDLVVDTLTRVGTLLSCYDAFSKVYDWSDQMREILLISYRHILEFWQSSVKLFTRRGLKTFGRGLGKPFESEWKKHKARLEEDLDNIRLYAQAAEANAARRREEERVEEHKKTQQESLRRDVMEWLHGAGDSRGLDMRDDLNRRSDLKHPGTCEWIFNDESFIQWKDSRAHKDILWFHGSPGTGKSVLSSAVISKLQSQELKVVYFFCEFKHPEKSQILSVLRSFAVQLLGLESCVPDEVRSLYDGELRRGSRYLSNLNVAANVVEALLKPIDRIHIILDGLDECDRRDATIPTLLRIFGAKNHGIIKWFLASRNEVEYRTMANVCSARCIEATRERTRSDLRRFLVDNPALAGHDEDCDEIEHWLNSSDGNFLWAHFMLKILSGCDLTCDEEITLEMERFPVGLTGCYVRTLHQLLAKPPSHQDLAKDIFCLVVLAQKNLTLYELIDALAARPRKDGSDPEDHSPARVPKRELIIALCSPLIVLDHGKGEDYSNPTLRLAHKSIQDFFLQDPDTLGIKDATRNFFVSHGQGHLVLGTVCLNYLTYKRYEQQLAITSVLHSECTSDHAFLRYAAVFWHDHLNKGEHCVKLFKRVRSFVQSSNFWNCLQIQREIAPYLLSRLTEMEDGYFKMQGPNGYESRGADNYSHALPLWLEEYGSEGAVLIESYMLFLKEWHHILVGCPNAVSQCHPGILGKHNVFHDSMKRNVGSILILQGPGSELDLEGRGREEIFGSSLQCAQGIIHLAVLEAEPQASGGHAHLSRWQITPDRMSSTSYIAQNGKTTKLISRSQVSLVSCTTFSSEDLTCSFTESGADIWAMDPIRKVLSRMREDDEEAFGPPADITPQSSVSDDSAFSTISHSISCKRVSGFGSGAKLAFHLSSGLEVDRSDASDSGFSSDQDDSSDILESQNHYLVTVHGGHEPSWFSWVESPDCTLRSMAAFHPEKSLVVWGTSDDKLLIGNMETGFVDSSSFSKLGDNEMSAGINGFQSSNVSHEGEPIVRSRMSSIYQDCHFSSCGTILHNLTIMTCVDSPFTSHTVTLKSYKLETSTTESLPPRISLLTQAPVAFSLKTLATQTGSASLKPQIFWTPSHVYLAINASPSLCSIKVFRLALSPSHPPSKTSTLGSSRTIEILHSPIYLPYSTPQRANGNIHFLVSTSPSSTTTQIHIFLSSHQSHKDNTPTLPAILLTYTAETDLGNWAPFEPATALDLASSESISVEEAAYLKGRFVAADQRFSLPIRSGLDWSRSSFVSCW